MSTLRVLSFNCWGLKYVSKNRAERIAALSDELAASNYDLVGLQELWVSADYELVRAKLASSLRFSKLFYSGALGAGLALFSRFPIVATSIHPYALNGSPLDVAGGDWFVGKSAASIVIDHPLLGEVEVFNTHMYARGGEHGPEEHRAHRLVNAWELAKLTRGSAELGRYVIALGDYNSIPGSLQMTMLRQYASLTDAWEQSRGHPSPPHSLTPQSALRDYGVTADSPLNSYSAGKTLDASTRKSQGKRLDYILFRHPAPRPRHSLSLSLSHNPNLNPSLSLSPSPSGAPCPHVLKAAAANVVLTGRVPGCDFSFSDHFGVEALFEIGPGAVEGDSSHAASASASAPALAPADSRPSRLTDVVLSTALQALVARYRTSRSQSRVQLFVFAGCVSVLVVEIVASPWLPRSWTNPIFLLFTVVVTWLGTTMLYSGFIFGNWEVRALMNVIEEMELVRVRQQELEGGRGGAVVSN